MSDPRDERSLARQLSDARRARCQVSVTAVRRCYVAGVTPLAACLAEPGIELAEDLRLEEVGGRPALAIRRPLRLEVTAPAGTAVLVLRPLVPSRAAWKLWASPAPARLDYFQVVNQRLQNYYAHLRRMPGTYDLDTWTQEELDAVAPTAIVRGELPSAEWATLVVVWGPEGYDPQRTVTRAWLNGVPLAAAAGLLHRLLLVADDVRDQCSAEATGYWHRMLLLSGVAVARYAELPVALADNQAQALSQVAWNAPASLVAAVQPPAFPAPTPLDLYANAPGIRLSAAACAPLPNALFLDRRQADRFRYWHWEAKDAPGGQALACLPDDVPIRWVLDVPTTGEYELVLNYSLMLLPPGAAPAVSVSLDGAPPAPTFTRCPLPVTTASGTQRPEPNRYQPVPLAGGQRVRLEAGRHELTLTFHDNGFLALAEVLVTPCALPLPTERLARYVRPPFLEFTNLVEEPAASTYTLVFRNAAAGAVAGALSLDEASDPGPAPVLSTTRLALAATGDAVTVTLTVPVTAEASQTRRLRLVWAEDQGQCRQVYYLRHRRPFALATRPRQLTPAVANYPGIPDDPAERQRQLQELLQDRALAPWRERTPAEIEANPPPLQEGHGARAMRHLTYVALLSGAPEHAARLRALLLGVARQTAGAVLANADGEKRADVRCDYGGARRGSIFGEVWPEDLLAYDLLLAAGLLSPADQLTIEGNLFWSGYENSTRFLGGELFYRGQAHNIMTAAMLAVITADAPMLDDVEHGLRRYGTWQIAPDGGHNEKVSSYGGSIELLVRMAVFLAEHGRPAVLTECRETIRQVCSALIRGSFSDGSMLRQGDGGLQGSFHILGGPTLVAWGRRLFPDDPEFVGLEEYSQTLHTRLWAKWNHRPVAEWPAMPERLLRRSDCFPEAGWVILRSGPGRERVEVSLDWSAFGDHGHPDKLNSVLFAFDEALSMDLSYGWPPDDHRCEGYAMRTVSHNTVVADGGCQYPGAKGRQWLYDHQDDVQVAWADAGACYPDGIRADRCLVLVGDTVVDLFCLVGGQRHTYDWLYHCVGDVGSSLPLLPRGPLSPPLRPFEKVADYPGYDLLHDLREAATADPTHFTWTVAGYTHKPWNGWEKSFMAYPLGTLHLDVLGAPETACVTGRGPFPWPDANATRPFVMVRRPARATVFAAVFQAVSAEGDNLAPRPPATVTAVPVTSYGQVLEPAQAIGVTISGPDRRITVVQRHTSGPLAAGPIQVTDADLTVLIQDAAGQPRALHAWNGTQVVVAGAPPWRSLLPAAVHQRWQ